MDNLNSGPLSEQPELFQELVTLLHKKTTAIFLDCEAELVDLVRSGLLLQPTIPILFELAINNLLQKLMEDYPTMEDAVIALRNEVGSDEGGIGGTHVI